MAKGIINDTNLIDIANAIRTKNGSATKYKPSEMATAIENITGGGTSKLYTGGSIYFKEIVEGNGDYFGFLSISPNIELENGEICKLIFTNYMELMTSDSLTTVSVDRIILSYSSSRNTYSGSFEVDLTQFGYGTYNMGIMISLEYGFAMISYSTEDTTHEPLNIGIYLEQTGDVADL